MREVFALALLVQSVGASWEPNWSKGTGGYKRCHRIARVFDVPVCVSKKAWTRSEAKCAHAVHVLAQLLDNDEDGVADDTQVLNRLKSKKMGMWITRDEKEMEEEDEPSEGRWMWMFVEEMAPNTCDCPTNRGASATDRSTWPAHIDTTDGCIQERDATTEETLHLITVRCAATALPHLLPRALLSPLPVPTPRSSLASRVCEQEAAAEIWPSIWGGNKNSDAGKACFASNGNCGWGYKGNWKNPSGNKCVGQYAYSDKTCKEDCIVVEGIYWASVSYIGGFYTRERAMTSQDEWLMTAPDAAMPVLPNGVSNARSLQTGSPALYELVSDTTSPGHAWLPRVFPNGRYSPGGGGGDPPSPTTTTVPSTEPSTPSEPTAPECANSWSTKKCEKKGKKLKKWCTAKKKKKKFRRDHCAGTCMAYCDKAKDKTYKDKCC